MPNDMFSLTKHLRKYMYSSYVFINGVTLMYGKYIRLLAVEMDICKLWANNGVAPFCRAVPLQQDDNRIIFLTTHDIGLGMSYGLSFMYLNLSWVLPFDHDSVYITMLYCPLL